MKFSNISCPRLEVYHTFPKNVLRWVKNLMNNKAYDYCKKSLPLLRNELLNICASYSLNYIDFYSVTENTNQLSNLQLDGIHFNPEGQNLLFETAKKYLN